MFSRKMEMSPVGAMWTPLKPMNPRLPSNKNVNASMTGYWASFVRYMFRASMLINVQGRGNCRGGFCQYLRDLERRVEELESYKEDMESDSTAQTKPQDEMERTSDNYGPDKIGNSSKKPLTNKRKSCEVGKTGEENNQDRLKDSFADNVTVSVTYKYVLIEIKCSWKDSMVVEAMDVVSKLCMDTQTVQSSNADEVLSMTIEAKCKGLRAPSPAVIRQALLKVIKK